MTARPSERLRSFCMPSRRGGFPSLPETGWRGTHGGRCFSHPRAQCQVCLPRTLAPLQDAAARPATRGALNLVSVCLVLPIARGKGAPPPPPLSLSPPLGHRQIRAQGLCACRLLCCLRAWPFLILQGSAPGIAPSPSYSVAQWDPARGQMALSLSAGAWAPWRSWPWT